ncbi:hypothetical protein NQ314_002297 [Rhamnusium bicolor]|uniref:DUF4371 domain-containing protein n=1 Tax=Rhamnusium bicolor TaxID=1586634 RepID=A0AAV8ZRX3_9CUCU|nr:hypothetical protein NQ314_002297 [Rhamnusium bicolor]
MLEEIQSGPSTFSIIIDESTDKGETAQDLFDALNSGLLDQGLNLQNMIGFAADTTNVMFGKHAGIVAKMKEVNPYWRFVKCVYYSIALAVKLSQQLKCRLLLQDELFKELTFLDPNTAVYAEFASLSSLLKIPQFSSRTIGAVSIMNIEK